MSSEVLILVAYYVVALAVVVAWVYRDHSATRRRTHATPESADRLIGAFVNRVSLLLALVAGVGSALTLSLLLHPRLDTQVTAAISVGASVLTFALLEGGLRLPRRFGLDPLPELRPTAPPTDAASSAEDVQAPPSDGA